MRNVIRFDAAQIFDVVNRCAQFEVSVPFTPERARFVSMLVMARRAKLAAILGE
jgi:hypothetical protein